MKRTQHGMVLLVSLVLLLMLSIIAITAASQSNLQLRISTNSQQQGIAFQAAESGLQQWALEYFSSNDIDKLPTDWSNKAIATGSGRSSVTLISAAPCQGYGLGRVSMNCFDITSIGEACESGTCTAQTKHRQGGQRRQLNN